MTRHSYSFVISSMLMLLSCRQDNDVAPDPASLPPHAQLFAGDTIGMVDQVLNIDLNANINWDAEQALDLNSDGSSDLLITIRNWYTLGGGANNLSWIKIINPQIQILGRYGDMHRQYRTDTISQDTNQNGQIIHTLRYVSGCDLVDFDSFTVNDDQFKPSYLTYGDSMNDLQPFSGDSLLIHRAPRASTQSNTHNTPDLITISSWVAYYSGCNTCELAEPFYLPFVFGSSGTDVRRGWLQMTHVHGSRIIIHGSALEP